MNTELHERINRHWWLWVLAMILLISGLWFCVKSCNQEEIVDRFTGAIRGAAAVIDSASTEAEVAAKAAMEGLDSTARVFKSKWTALGNYINVRLGEFNLSVPQRGLEIKILDWVQDKSTVDKSAWYNFDRILFESGSASLNKVSDEQINNIAMIMKAIPTVEFEIGGYTDNIGDLEANRTLSMQRAESVKSALITAGVDAKRLTAQGYGAEDPIADNNTEEGKEMNRRVAIRVTKK